MNYTWLKAEDEDGKQLVKRAKRTANFNIDYYGFSKTHINLNTQYIGDRKSYTGKDTGNYVVSNLNINYTLNRDIKLYGKIDNITDKKYQVVDGYATTPRAFYVGINYKFK